MILNIWENIQKFFESIKNFFLENSHNPFLWISIVLLGLLIFEFTYRALHKD